VPRNPPPSSRPFLVQDKHLLVAVPLLLAAAPLQPDLGPLGRGPRERPLVAGEDYFANVKGDVTLLRMSLVR